MQKYYQFANTSRPGGVARGEQVVTKIVEVKQGQSSSYPTFR